MTLALAATFAVLAYAGACWALPFTRCWSCRGQGYRTTLLASRMRPCRTCKGSGRHLRLGRRVANYFARIHRDATRRRTNAGKA